MTITFVEMEAVEAFAAERLETFELSELQASDRLATGYAWGRQDVHKEAELCEPECKRDCPDRHDTIHGVDFARAYFWHMACFRLGWAYHAFNLTKAYALWAEHGYIPQNGYIR